MLGSLGWSSKICMKRSDLSTLPPSALYKWGEGAECPFLKTLYFHLLEIWHSIMIVRTRHFTAICWKTGIINIQICDVTKFPLTCSGVLCCTTCRIHTPFSSGHCYSYQTLKSPQSETLATTSQLKSWPQTGIYIQNSLIFRMYAINRIIPSV